MDITWFNVESTRLIIALPWARLLWNQASGEIYNLRPLFKTDNVVSLTEEPEILPWSWPSIRPFIPPALSRCSWATHKPLISSILKSTDQLVFVFCDCSALLSYLKVFTISPYSGTPQKALLLNKDKMPCFVEGQKEAWCLGMSEYSCLVQIRAASKHFEVRAADKSSREGNASWSEQQEEHLVIPPGVLLVRDHLRVKSSDCSASIYSASVMQAVSWPSPHPWNTCHCHKTNS